MNYKKIEDLKAFFKKGDRICFQRQEVIDLIVGIFMSLEDDFNGFKRRIGALENGVVDKKGKHNCHLKPNENQQPGSTSCREENGKLFICNVFFQERIEVDFCPRCGYSIEDK
jgi:hypothetical protein